MAISKDEKQFASNNKVASNDTSVNNFSQIKELKELLDMGAISQEEFEEKKKRDRYRRINALLRKENIIVSEEIVRKIMNDNRLPVQVLPTR